MANDKTVRVLVPLDWLKPPEVDRRPDRREEPQEEHTAEARPDALAAFQEALRLLGDRLARADARADSAETRADREAARANSAEADAREARSQAQAAQARAEKAEQDRTAAVAIADSAVLAAEVARAEADADMAELRERLVQEIAVAQHDVQAAQQGAAELRLAEEQRKGQGRWARLRAAWRGE